MGLLERFKGRPPEVSASDFHASRAMGHVGARAFLAELESGQFDAALARYRAASGQLREFYIAVASSEDVLGGEIALPGWSTQFVERHPDEGLAWTLKGALGIAAGWHARGHYRAQHVEDSAWDVFFRFLNQADEDLLHATTVDPADASPWTGLVTLGRGLQLPIEERWLRFHEATRRADDLFVVHQQMLQGLCAKWSGSHEQMFAFARETAAASPPGSPRHALVVEAHLEQWIDVECRPSEYFLGAPRTEIKHAADQCVLHPQFLDDADHPSSATARNVFAVGLTLSGWRREAFDQATLMGGRLSEWPWVYLSADAPGRLAYVLNKGPG